MKEGTWVKVRRVVYAIGFCCLVLVEWARGSISWDVWGVCVPTVGIIMAIMLLFQFSWKKEPLWIYALWLVVSLLPIIGREHLPFVTLETQLQEQSFIAEALNVPFLGIVTIRLIRYFWGNRGYLPRIHWGIAALWIVLTVFLATSRYGEKTWAVWYFWMSALLFLIPFEEQDKRAFADGMADGILMGFIIIQGFAFLYRAYDIVRYTGAFFNCNSNALLYLVTYTFLLYRIHSYAFRLRENRSLTGFARWKCIFQMTFSYFLAGVVLALTIYTLTRTAIIMAVFVTVAYSIVTVFMVLKARPGTVLRQQAVLLVFTLLMVPVMYLSIRYVPTVINRAVIFEGEKDYTGKVQPGEDPESEKYVTFPAFMNLFWSRLRIREILSNLVSWDGMTVYAAEEVPEEETQEKAGIPVFADPSLQARFEIWKVYWENLNWEGHTSIEGELEYAPGKFSYHAHNVFLQILFSYGIPAGVLFSIMMVLLGVKAVKLPFKRRGPEDILPLLVWIIFIGYGMTEMVCSAGYMTLILIYVAQKFLINGPDQKRDGEKVRE